MKLQRLSPDSEPPGYLYGSIGIGLVDELLPTYGAAVTPLENANPSISERISSARANSPFPHTGHFMTC